MRPPARVAFATETGGGGDGKIYEKPVLTKREKLSTVIAAISSR